jgi:SMI1-KNR4 cell-wall
MPIEVSKTYGPIPQGAFERLERAVGAPLPTLYRDFLLRFNGGRLNYEFFEIQSLDETTSQIRRNSLLDCLYGFTSEHPTSDLIQNYQSSANRIPKYTLPIGCDQGDNLLLMVVGGSRLEQILYWARDYEVDFENGVEPDYSNVGFIAPNILEFIKGLKPIPN